MMSISQLLLILFTVILLSAGQVLFKLASSDLVLTPAGLLQSFLSVKLMLALAVYAVATILWLIALKNVPLRVAYPFVASAFFIVPALAHFFLGEELGWNTYAGAGLIALGVIVSVSR